MRNLAKWILPIGLLLFALGARGQVVISEVMAKNETVLTAAEELQRWIGRKTELCCYPFGHRTPDTDAALDKAGFLPVTLLPGMIAKGQTALRRNLLKDRFSLRENIGRILGAWVSVLPSHSENFGGVVVEALAQGTPVIASKSTPWQILEESECGWWTENDDDSLSDVLKTALEMMSDARTIRSSKAIKLVREKFSWQASARALDVIYRDACGFK